MQPLVCDTGPLVALSYLDLLDLVPALYRPLVTPAVLAEWKAADGRSDLPPSFEITTKPPTDPLLTHQLDPGEASVIQFAVTNDIARILIDERKGRRIARRVFGLEAIGTAGLLVQAKRRGLTGGIAPLFARLKEQGYWIDDAIVTWALDEASSG